MITLNTSCMHWAEQPSTPDPLEVLRRAQPLAVQKLEPIRTGLAIAFGVLMLFSLTIMDDLRGLPAGAIPMTR
jgi:hypothetical protein